MDMCFGARVSAERRRLKFTQNSFAAAMGIAPCTQALFEDDHRLPTIDYLARAAQLGVDVDFVLLGHRAEKLTIEHSHHRGFATPHPPCIQSPRDKKRPVGIG